LCCSFCSSAHPYKYKYATHHKSYERLHEGTLGSIQLFKSLVLCHPKDRFVRNDILMITIIRLGISWNYVLTSTAYKTWAWVWNVSDIYSKYCETFISKNYNTRYWHIMMNRLTELERTTIQHQLVIQFHRHDVNVHEYKRLKNYYIPLCSRPDFFSILSNLAYIWLVVIKE
jgi:hypothetical protein